MGLLGYDDQDLSQGLLSFGQMAAQRRPFLGLLAGLAAADRSQAGRAELKRQSDIENRKIAIEEALKNAQIGEINAQRQQRLAEAEAAQRKAERAGQFGRALLGAGTVSPEQALAGGGGPTVANAARIGQSQPIDWQTLSLQFPEQIDQITKLAAARNLGRNTVARTAEVDDGFGGKATIQLDEFGDSVGRALPGYVAPVQVNQGDKITFAKPQAGLSLAVGMSPGERDASARGWASLAEARRNSGEKAPVGYRFKADGSLEAIPGGPADIKAGEAGQKAEARRQAGLAGADNVLDAIADAKKAVSITTAGPGSLLSAIPGTPARNLAATLETVKANFGFDRLQQMRDMSPTGGALGQVAVQELTALQSTVASLDQAQSPSQLAARLDKAQRHYENWKKTLGGQPTATSGMPSADAIAAELERRRRASGSW